MAEIINLRTARKRKARETHSRAAEINRTKFGRTKAEKRLASLSNSHEQKKLDGHKREEPSKAPSPSKQPPTD